MQSYLSAVEVLGLGAAVTRDTCRIDRISLHLVPVFVSSWRVEIVDSVKRQKNSCSNPHHSHLPQLYHQFSRCLQHRSTANPLDIA